MSDRLIALDLGTTGVRALVVDAAGAVHARAYRPLETFFPAPGRVEQDPSELWTRSLEVLREALAGAGTVAGIGVVTQRSTVLAWDARSGEPLAPALSWQDQRSAERVAGMRAAGIPITTLASATKLEWWLEHEPAVRKAAAEGRLRLGTPDVWLSDRLTGGEVHVTDPGQASCTALYDPNAGEWAQPLCDLFGVPREALPEIVPTSRVVGETPRALLGVPIPVAARAGDQQASAFGQGVRARGDAKLTLGTSAMLDLHTGRTVAEPVPASFPLALWQLGNEATEFCLEGQVITAGAAVDWLVSLGIAKSGTDVDTLARAARSADGVVFVPALQGLGTPYGDDNARGLFAGLTRGSGREQLARAVLEGIAQRLVDLFDALEPERPEIPVDGGLARSDFLLQTVADLSGRGLLRARETETTALGAAALAGLAVGIDGIEDGRGARARGTPFASAISADEREARRARWTTTLAASR